MKSAEAKIMRFGADKNAANALDAEETGKQKKIGNDILRFRCEVK